MIACSGDIVLPGVYLSLCFVRQDSVNAPRQNNNMNRSRFASSSDSCAVTKVSYEFLFLSSANDEKVKMHSIAGRIATDSSYGR